MADIWECAYCGPTTSQRTKEHLFPKALHRRLQEANNAKHIFWLLRLDKEVAGEPTIKDVCERCNSGFMAKLDDYICHEFDGQFATIRQHYEKVTFNYDFHPLKRWMLKMAYNSARLHSSADTFALKAVLPYIRGENNHLGRSVRLFLQLSYPGPISTEERAQLGGDEVPEVWEPRLNRAGLSEVKIEGVGRKIVRHISLQSYTFFLSYSNPVDGASVNKDFAEQFLKRAPTAVEIKASQSSVTAVCDGINAWDAFKQARSTKLT